ncbi:MAG: hypothetical protein ACRDIB_10945 [Ardenticatenaceae bacterium]
MPRLLLVFQAFLRTPLAQSALVLTLVAVLVVQPAAYWMQQQPAISFARSTSVVPPLVLKGRALPDGEVEYIRRLARNTVPQPDEDQTYTVGRRYGANLP